MPETNETIVAGYRSMKRIRIVNIRFLQKIQEEPYAYEAPPLEVIYREAFQSGVTPEQYVKINQAEDRSYYAEMLQASQKAQTDMQRIYFVHKLCFFYQIFLNLLEFVVFLFS